MCACVLLVERKEGMERDDAKKERERKQPVMALRDQVGGILIL